MMGLGLTHLLRKLLITKNLLSFTLRKKLIGFDAAALFLQRVDKNSVIPILRKYGATIGKDCDIETGLIFHNCSDFSRLIIGNNCHIGKNCFFDLKARIILSDNVVVSMKATFITHIDVGKTLLREIYPPKAEDIIIGNDTYIGANVMIMSGVKLDPFTLVAANSTVIGSFESGVVIGGTPARQIKKLNF